MRTPDRRATGRRKQHSPRREKHPTEGISGSPSGSKSWLREKIASCDSNRWIPRSDNNLACVGRSTVSTCSSDNSWKPIAAHAPGGDPATAAGPARRKFSRSPFVAAPVDQLGKDYTPPQRHQVLKPDFQVQPQPRSREGTSGTRQAFRPGTAGGLQQQDPQSRRNSGSQVQSQGQNVNQGNRQGESDGQSQDAPRNQPRGESKKKTRTNSQPTVKRSEMRIEVNEDVRNTAASMTPYEMEWQPRSRAARCPRGHPQRP